jgi:hypothetical protein
MRARRVPVTSSWNGARREAHEDELFQRTLLESARTDESARRDRGGVGKIYSHDCHRRGALGREPSLTYYWRKQDFGFRSALRKRSEVAGHRRTWGCLDGKLDGSAICCGAGSASTVTESESPVAAAVCSRALRFESIRA